MSASRKMSLPTQMAIGMFLGIIAGFIVPKMGLGADWFKPIGQLFINLIRMVVVPLVVCTLIAGAASVEDVRKLGRVATKTLLYYFVTTAIAVCIGLFLANLFDPGYGVNLSTEGLKAKDVQAPSLVDTLLNIVPMNPMNAMSQGNMLQIIFFSIIFGFGLSSIKREEAQPLLRFFESASTVMIRVTNIVMVYAPIGVFGLIAYTVANHGVEVLLPLIKVIGVLYLGALVHVCLVYIPVVRYCGLKPMQFLKGIAEPILIAFTTCSSAAALPSNLKSVQKLGASKTASSFSIPLGNTINMDGTAIYMGVAAIFVSEIYGIPMPFDKQLTVLLLACLASIGTVGVPGAALIMVTIIFTQIGVPLEGIALIAGIDRVLDMARTTLNVMGDAAGALLVSKMEGDLGEPVLSEEV